MEGDHESYDTKVAIISEYTSNKKTASKNTYPFGRSSGDTHAEQTDTQSVKTILIGVFL
jgi:hypothetical protein